MRWSTREQHEHYAQLTRLLRGLRNYVEANPRVRVAFLRYSGLSEAQMREVTTLGNRPLFDVAPIQLPGGVTANGRYNSQTNLVTIDLVVASEVEHQRSLSENLARQFLYSTCLHELVHYGRHQTQLSPTVNGNEAGKMFECEAYQGDIGWDGHSSRLTQRRSGTYHGTPWSCPLSTLVPNRPLSTP